jgi:Fe-Mn family superoxide dismutase
MRYQIAPLFCRPWTLLGITPRLIESHYENNYGGAFTRLTRRMPNGGSLAQGRI